MMNFRMHTLSVVGSVFLLFSLASCGGGSSAGPDNNNEDNTPTKSQWTTLGNRQSASVTNSNIRTVGAAPQWQDYNRADDFSNSVTEENIQLEMDDGVLISLNVVRPVTDSGEEVGPLPTVVTFTPYNKNVGDLIPLGGAIIQYFITHGYNQVLIDVRGTGRSGGGWDPFGAREQQDYPQVLDWIIEQPWSNGDLGIWGISASATPALFLAGTGHPAIKAIFPIVPHGDIYRDVVFVGGQASAAFLPAWMSVVTALGILNPSFYDQPEQYVVSVIEHLTGLGDFFVPKLAEVLTGQDSSFDSDYWSTKAPLEVANNSHAPTFIVGGLFDIFQRSEPLNYEALKNQTNTKLLIGPWDHLQAADGESLPLDGVPELDRIALQWFDHYLKDMDNGAEDLPAVTQWVWGHEHFVVSPDWPHPAASAQRLFLQTGGTLGTEMPAASVAPSMVLQQPIGGVCSESTLQITLGIVGYIPLPCWKEDNLANALELTFDTPVMEEDFYINGPIQADIWMSTTALDAGLVVRVSDVGPDGKARALTSGLQTASLRAVDGSRSRYLDGQMIQPWHPYTKDAVETVGLNNIVSVPIEIFPTSALIKEGHSLRISVGPSNFPFATMPAPTLLQSIVGLLSIYHDAEHPSSVVLPVVPVSQINSN